jgi:prepilin-type N-terminal cleavage/methylation domain-containing protein
MTRRRKPSGFTLVELTVALVAGLIVALAIVGLSREATTTFHEEVRISAAEASLRTAVDRLRSDLQRAAYMSTPNIMGDPSVCTPVGSSNVAGINPLGAGIRRLAGIHLIDGGSLANGVPLSQSQPTALDPDALEIGGNLTSTESFDVQSVSPIGGGCAQLVLSASSPSLYRIGAITSVSGVLTNVPAELNNIFQPVAANDFIVRLVDDTGHTQYLATCPGTPAGFDGTNWFVNVNLAIAPVLTAQATGNRCGIPPVAAGHTWINPVQVVRWEITNAANEPAQYKNALNRQSLAPTTADPNKYDLVRSYLDIGGNVIAASTEVIAEYAIDFNVAFSVDNGLSAAAPVLVTIPFDSAVNQTWADDLFLQQVATNRPNRIRIVRARIATRAAQPDRSVNIPINPGNYGAQAFLYRYCLVSTGCTNGKLQWARARTLTTEVSLPNQAGAYIP